MTIVNVAVDRRLYVDKGHYAVERQKMFVWEWLSQEESLLECGCKSTKGLSPSNNNYIYILLPNRPNLELTYVFIVKPVCILAFCKYFKTVELYLPNVIFGMRLHIKKEHIRASNFSQIVDYLWPSFSTFEIWLWKQLDPFCCHIHDVDKGAKFYSKFLTRYPTFLSLITR